LEWLALAWCLVLEEEECVELAVLLLCALVDLLSGFGWVVGGLLALVSVPPAEHTNATSTEPTITKRFDLRLSNTRKLKPRQA